MDARSPQAPTAVPRISARSCMPRIWARGGWASSRNRVIADGFRNPEAGSPIRGGYRAARSSVGVRPVTSLNALLNVAKDRYPTSYAT